MRFLPAAILLVLAGLGGLLADAARDDAGIIPSPGRVPLGGFEPLAVDLLFLRADQLLQEQRLPEAMAAVRLVTELQPRVPDGWAVLGHYIAWRNSESSGDPEEQWKYAREALGIYRRGLRHNPDSYDLQFAFGMFVLARLTAREDIRPIAERELGEPPSALALSAFRKAVHLRPDERPAIAGVGESARLLGLRLLERGDRDGARSALRESLTNFERLIERSDTTELQDKLSKIRSTLDELSRR